MNKNKSPVQAAAGPSLLVSEDIERFEGVVKKVLDHRTIVEKFEKELEERENNSSSGLTTEDLEEEDSKEEKPPQVIYVQGQRQTIGEQKKDLREAGNDNRRSHSEIDIKAIKKGIEESNAKTNKYKNPLALDLEQVIGKDNKTDKVFS